MIRCCTNTIRLDWTYSGEKERVLTTGSEVKLQVLLPAGVGRDETRGLARDLCEQMVSLSLWREVELSDRVVKRRGESRQRRKDVS